MNDDTMNAFLNARGYRPLGGVTNRVYRHEGRGEVLKLAAEGTDKGEKTADFIRCLEVSREYAPLALMPEVFEAGPDYAGTGLPFVRERYVPGVSMSEAYLRDPAFWQARLPGALAEIYGKILRTPSADVTQTWRGKLEGMERPAGYERYIGPVVDAGLYLMDHTKSGYRIHGDLQLGNLLALEEGGVLLIDWEMSETMPLGYEFAMLFTFVMDPAGQVDKALESAYEKLGPLRALWRAVAAMLERDLGVGREEMTMSTLFRMGNAWLYQLNRALAAGDGPGIEGKKQGLERLLYGDFFSALTHGA